MNPRMRRMLLLSILLVTLSECLIIHWAARAIRGAGFNLATGTLFVIALGGIPNKTQVGDMGIDGRIFPVPAAPKKAAAAKGETPAFEEFLHHWYPIQVKQ